MVEISPQEYLTMANQAYIVAYVTAVCATTLLYDYALTFGEEITRMWTLRFSIPKILFLVNRYVVIPMLVFNGIGKPAFNTHHSSLSFLPLQLHRGLIFRKTCVFYLRWLVVCITVTHATIEGILLTRVWALYRDNTPILVVACCLYAAGVSTLVGLTIHDYVGEDVLIVQDFSTFPGCYAASVPAIIAGYWIAPVIVESVLFALVMWRAFAWWKDRSAAPPTLTMMARDSAVYFFVIFVLLIVNLFVFEYAPPFLSSLFVTPSNTAGCIAGSRLLLNLRSLSDPGGTELEMSTGIRFTRGSRPGNTTALGGSELTGTTYTVGAPAEGYSTELERDDKPAAIQEVEIGPSRSNGCSARHIV